jgi:PAS domain S-box-containing protein
VNLGLWDWDLKTGKIWATKSCREMFGMGETEALTRRSFADSILPEDRSRVQSEIDDALAKQQPFETEYRVTLPNEPPRWIATKGSPREDVGQGVRRLVGVVQDVTARKQAELEAEQQRQELAHLTRVSILGALSGALAHELNQPLTAILANAEAATYILSQDPVDMEEIRQILQDIIHDDKRAGDVIKHLRALLKKDESLMRTISVNELVAEVLALAHSDLILKDVAVSRQLGYELPAIHGDPIQLQQVLLNLIINACEAMSGKPTADRLLSVETTSNGNGEIRVSISDTGEGLSPTVSEKLFDPFYTTKTLGLGLGLPICRSIITAHGGRLWAETTARQGAVFHVELPIQTGSHA